jgi:hypothetical protein
MHTTPQKRLFRTPSEILVHRGVCILNGMALEATSRLEKRVMFSCDYIRMPMMFKIINF